MMARFLLYTLHSTLNTHHSPPYFCQLMKTLLIANPIAGKGRALAAALQVQAHNPQALIELYQTKAAGDATQRTALAVAEGYECVVAVGGDGTVNEVAQALVHTEVALGIVPVGSGNGLARHLGYPMQPVQAFAHILQAQPRRIDYGLVNGKPFFTTFGVGFDGLVAQAFAERRGSRGLMRYVALALSLYRRYVPFEAQFLYEDEQLAEKHIFSIVFGNANQFGNNFYICPDASLTDGLLDMTLIKRQSILNTLQLMLKILQRHSFKELATERKIIQSTILCSSKIPYHLDGEFAGMEQAFEVKAVPDGLVVKARIS